jgi:hypothetical protein
MAERRKTRVSILLLDRNKPIEAGKNPLQMDELRIDYVRRVDERAKIAKEAAEKKVGRPSQVARHGEGGSVTVIFKQEG